MVPDGAISVSMSMTGMPASIILLTGAVRVPMPNAWMATKSHFCEAISSIAARCLTASSWPSNQVTSTLNSLPQYSAACLPWAHQVACSPAFENAALSGFSDLPASLAIAEAMSGLKPNPPNSAPLRRRRRRPGSACGDLAKRFSLSRSLLPPCDAALLAIRRYTVDHAIEIVCGSIRRRRELVLPFQGSLEQGDFIGSEIE